MGIMQYVNGILSRLAHESVIIAGAAVGIAYATSVILGVLTYSLNDLIFFLIIFVMMFSVYRINKIMDLDEDQYTHPARASFFKNQNRTKTELFLLPIILYMLVFIFSFFYNFDFFVIMVFSLAWIICYSLNFPTQIASRIGVKKVKQIPFAKTMYSSVAWALIVIMVATFYKVPLNQSIWFLFVYIFLRFSINAISFDMRDIKGDTKIGNKTIPVIFGKHKTVAFLQTINFLSTGLLVLGVITDVLPVIALSLLLTLFYAYYFLEKFFDPKENINALCDIVIDGEFIFWILFISIGNLALGLLA